MNTHNTQTDETNILSLPYEILQDIFILAHPTHQEEIQFKFFKFQMESALQHGFIQKPLVHTKNPKLDLAFTCKLFNYVYEKYSKRVWFSRICTLDYPKFRDEHLHKVPYLKELSVAKNTKISTGCLSKMTFLKSLTINGSNRVRPNHLTKLTSLESLKLLNNISLAGTGDFLTNLISLKSLSLHNTIVYRVPTFIRDLSLSSGSYYPGNINELTNLKTLALREFPYSYQNIGEILLGLTCLTNLKLCSMNSQFTDDILCKLTHLKKLSIRDTPHLTIKGLQTLTNLTKLELNNGLIDPITVLNTFSHDYTLVYNYKKWKKRELLRYG
jgi:hypothetical protein